MQVYNREIKEIVINRLQRRELKDFARIHCNPVDGIRPVWCDGMVLALYAYADVEFIVKERTAGILYYEEVDYAECPKYLPRLSDGKTEYETPILDMTGDDLIGELVSCIRDGEFKTDRRKA